MVATLQGNAARNKAAARLHAGIRDAAHAIAKLKASLDADMPVALRIKANILGSKIGEAMVLASASFPPTASELPKMENHGPIALIEKAGGRVVLYVHGEVVRSVVADQSTKSAGEVSSLEALAERLNIAAGLGR